MGAFQVKDFDMTGVTKRPSLTSVVAQKKRLAAIAKGESISGDTGNPSATDGMTDQAADHSAFNQAPQLAEVNETYTPGEEKILAEAKAMSLVGHLNELRNRLIVAIIAIAIGFGVAYYFVDSILAVLVAPAGKLYYMRPTEAFFTSMKIAFVGGVILASPIWLYQIWAFVIPALSKGEKKMTMMILPAAIILFLVGIAFSYFLVLPAAIQFFIGFATDDLQPLLSIGQYIDFVISFILPFGVIFELPLILIALASLGIITSEQLAKKRKIFIFVAFIIGGGISPTPDMFSQTMIALPMVVLYEASVQIIKRVIKA